MIDSEDFRLYQWIEGNVQSAKTAVLAGSATPALSLDEITHLSSNPIKTKEVFASISSLPLSLASGQGALPLRQNIVTNSASSSKITVDNVLVANGTTGANHIVYRSLLKHGDHVIVQYPSYGPLIEEPHDIGCEISYWRLDNSKDWTCSSDELRRLIRPGVTKLIIINNPNNPTGTYLDASIQREVIKLAKEFDIPIHCDEIFFPLFHRNISSEPTLTNGSAHKAVPSMNEHSDLFYDSIITTSSLSKVWGLSGVRIGWIITRCPKLYAKFERYRLFSVQACSYLDEIIATEVLSSRCRPNILKKHLDIAHQNIEAIDRFVKEHPDQVDWVKPTAGATAFIRFRDAKTGLPRDDIDFSSRLLKEKGVLVSPGSSCFEILPANEYNGQNLTHSFRGRVRMHLTAKPEVVEKGLRAIAEFLESD